LIQELPGNPISRTNLIQRFFFLTKLNQDLLGTGYEVIPDDANGCVGALYTVMGESTAARWSRSANSFCGPGDEPEQDRRWHCSLACARLLQKRVSRHDQPVHIEPMLTFPLRAAGPWTNIANALAFNSVPFNSAADLNQAACYFMSNAVPGYVELELEFSNRRRCRDIVRSECPQAARHTSLTMLPGAHLPPARPSS
jgi:hypothetical protein